MASCQTQKYRTTKMGRRPSTSVTIEKKNCPRNMTTFAPISAFRAVESGPGPNEKEEAYSEEFRRIGADRNRTTSGRSGDCLSPRPSFSQQLSYPSRNQLDAPPNS
ncbi:MAG: hypothetical protein E6K11_10320 [Methanobacteriota archaeon]|nr:MAG: hypothetical protein E6K11_10320 [Euryarchaeota archaeon]